MVSTCVFLRSRLHLFAVPLIALVLACGGRDANDDAGQQGSGSTRKDAGDPDTDGAVDAADSDGGPGSGRDAASSDGGSGEAGTGSNAGAGGNPAQDGGANEHEGANVDGGPLRDSGASDAAPEEDAGPEADGGNEVLEGWFVDSVSGNDDNDGRSVAAPFATLAKLRASAVKSGETIHLARGSLWREELIGLPPTIVVRAYGDGPRPIIDASDVAPNASFQKTAGLSNVYEIAWQHQFDIDGGKSAHRAWEDGVRLRRVPDVATCDATPGSFYAPEPTSGGPDTIYVHPSDSSEIESNGRVYELTRRRNAIQLYGYSNHAKVYSIHTRRNSYADGSLMVDGLISDCLAEDGRVHNVLIRGTCEDTTAWKIEPPSWFGAATMFVSFEDRHDIPQVRYTRCKAIADSDALGPTGGRNLDLTVGFYGHTSQGWRFGTAIYEECEATGVALAFGFLDVTDALYYKCSAKVGSIVAGGTPDRTLAILGGTFHAALDGSTLIKVNTDPGIPKKVVVRGVRLASAGGHNTPVWINRADGYTEVTRSTFYVRGGGIFWLEKGSFIMRNNIFAGSNSIFRVYTPGVTYEADGNLYFNTNRDTPEALLFQRDLGPLIDGLSNWRTATGQDAISVHGDAQFVGNPLMGEFGVAPGSPAQALGAGAEFQREEDDALLQSYRQALMAGDGL